MKNIKKEEKRIKELMKRAKEEKTLENANKVMDFITQDAKYTKDINAEIDKVYELIDSIIKSRSIRNKRIRVTGTRELLNIDYLDNFEISVNRTTPERIKEEKEEVLKLIYDKLPEKVNKSPEVNKLKEKEKETIRIMEELVEWKKERKKENERLKEIDMNKLTNENYIDYVKIRNKREEIGIKEGMTAKEIREKTEDRGLSKELKELMCEKASYWSGYEIKKEIRRKKREIKKWENKSKEAKNNNDEDMFLRFKEYARESAGIAALLKDVLELRWG